MKPATAATTTKPATTTAVQPATTASATPASTAAAARAKEDAVIAAARAKTIENTRQKDKEVEAVRAKQIAINKDTKTNGVAGTKPATTSTGTPSGYNTSKSSQTVIGSNPITGGATDADKAAMDKINADSKALKDKYRKPGT